MKRGTFALALLFACIMNSNAVSTANTMNPELTDGEILTSVQNALDSKLAVNDGLGLMRLRIVMHVINYMPVDVFERIKKSETEVSAKVVVESFVNKFELSTIMKQRKKERDFFGMIGKEREDVKDKQLQKELIALSGQFIIASITFKKSLTGEWLADQNSLRDQYVTQINSTVTAALKKRKVRLQKEQKQKEKAANTYAKNVKQWIKNDENPWVTEDYIIKYGRVDYYTGNSARVTRLKILEKARICEDIAIYNAHLTISPPSRTLSEPFLFKKIDDLWVAIHPLVNSAQLRTLGKVSIANSLRQEVKTSLKKKQCSDGSRFNVKEAEKHS